MFYDRILNSPLFQFTKTKYKNSRFIFITDKLGVNSIHLICPENNMKFLGKTDHCYPIDVNIKIKTEIKIKVKYELV